MRESLTIFAILLIALLSALLVGPYLIDWNGQRAWLAARLSQAVGAEVRIGGTVDVKLLPRPLFRASDVSIAGATPQDPALSAAGIDAELSINGLLQGAVEFVEATLVKPRLAVTTRDDGSLVVGRWEVANPGKVTVRHLRIRDGSLAVRDPAGGTRATLTGLDAEGEAETLAGPFRLGGQVRTAEGTTRFRLNVGAYAGRRVRVKLVADAAASPGHVDLDGALALAPDIGSGSAAVSFAGTAIASGSLHVADGSAPVPWQVTAADLKLDGKGASTTALELRAGADLRALVANGAVLLDFGAVPSAVVQLKARQLDLDRIAVPPEVAPDTPRPRAAQWRAALGTALSGQGDLPLRLKLDWAIDAVTAADLTLTDAAGTLDLAPGAPLKARFAIAGPDGFRLGLDGTVERGPAAVFRGHAEAATRALTNTADWLAPLAPELADWVAGHAVAGNLSLDGTVDLSATGLAARDLTATLDGSTVTGALALTRGVGGTPARLFADLRADTLDTGRFPTPGDVAQAVESLDLSIGVAARSLHIVHAGLGTLETGPLALHLTKAGPAVTLDTFTLNGLDGASVTATAALAADRSLKAQGHIKAGDVAPLAALVRQIVPGELADKVIARSAALSPAALDVGLTGSLDANGALVPTLATVRGTAAATRLSLSITPEPARLFAAPAHNLLAVLDAPDGAGLLRQAGIDGLAAGLGAGHVELTARGTPDTGYALHVAGSLGDTTLGFEGRSDGAGGTGRGTLASRNAAPLLKALAAASPPATALWLLEATADLGWNATELRADGLSGRLAGAAVTGALARDNASGKVSGSLSIDNLAFASLVAPLLGPPATAPAPPGRWLAGTPFGPPATLPPAEIAVQVGRLDLAGGLALDHAGFTLRLAPGSLGLSALTGTLLGGKASGTLTLRRDGAMASLSGQIGLEGISVAVPSLVGRLTASASVAGSGANPDALAASLAGDGALSFAGSLPRFDPQALAATAKAYDAEGVSLDPEAIRTALGLALDRGALDLGTLGGPVTIAAGTLRTGTLRGGTPLGSVTADATLDLRSAQLILRSVLTAASLPKDWKGEPPTVTVTWRGPLLAPSRDVDAAAFANGLTGRAIQREQDRIQLMQDDLRERAFFARRLRQMDEAAREAAAARAAAIAAEKAKATPMPPVHPPSDPIARIITTQPMPPAVAPMPPTRPVEQGAAGPVDLQPGVSSRSTAPPPPNEAVGGDPSAEGRY